MIAAGISCIIFNWEFPRTTPLTSVLQWLPSHCSGYSASPRTAVATVASLALQWLQWLPSHCSGYSGFPRTAVDTVSSLALRWLQWLLWLPSHCNGYSVFPRTAVATVSTLALQLIRWLLSHCNGYSGWKKLRQFFVLSGNYLHAGDTLCFPTLRTGL